MPAGCNSPAMLTELYIEALQVDEDLADQVWEAWDAGEICDFVAVWAWWSIVRAGPIYTPSVILSSCNDKTKPAKRGGRKATGPRFLRDVRRHEGRQDCRAATYTVGEKTCDILCL